MHQNGVLTVSQLNGYIKEVLNMGFPAGVWVCGEIQGFNRNRDKSHVFFELCEKDPVSKDVLARIGLVVFSGRKLFIEQVLKNSENAFQLKDDIEVKFLCKVDFYPPHGAVRLIVESIDPTYTLGKIAQEKQRLIVLLKKNGTLDQNKRLAIPLVPLRMGLITSYDSAAYNDFISELQLSGYGFKVFCRNALMQGKGSPRDICLALDELERIANLDVIVITRGGGSIADLSCFDSQMIAERIADCQVPVLSGIGHEINITITDLAAHTYQKTPTAIAQFLKGMVESFLDLAQTKVSGVIELTQERLGIELQRLKDSAMSLQGGTNGFLQQHFLQMVRRQEQVTQRPLALIKKAGQRVQLDQELLNKNLRSRIKLEDQRLTGFGRFLELANPQNTLKRGFSITRLLDGTLLRSSKQTQPGKVIVTELSDGQIKATLASED